LKIEGNNFQDIERLVDVLKIDIDKPLDENGLVDEPDKPGLEPELERPKVGPISPRRLNLLVTYRYEVISCNIPRA
jgi:hypothetical protein